MGELNVCGRKVTRLRERRRRWGREARNAATATAKTSTTKLFSTSSYKKLVRSKGAVGRVGPSAYIHPFQPH
jgi:hypothetical protein